MMGRMNKKAIVLREITREYKQKMEAITLCVLFTSIDTVQGTNCPREAITCEIIREVIACKIF